MAKTALSTDDIYQELYQSLELEFAFFRGIDQLIERISHLPRKKQDFLLGWTRRVASIQTTLAYQFLFNITPRIDEMEMELIERLALHAMDKYDREGINGALKVVRDVEDFAAHSHAIAEGALFEDVQGVLFNFIQGLSGRHLKIKQADNAYTDSSILYLPAAIADLPTTAENFTLCKATLTLLWAQTRYGSCQVDFEHCFASYDDSERAQAHFHYLETLRLEACIQRELPGLYRQMQQLKQSLGQAVPAYYHAAQQCLIVENTNSDDSLECLKQVYTQPLPTPLCYQGHLNPEAICQCRAQRQQKELQQLQVKLSELLEDNQLGKQSREQGQTPEIKAQKKSEQDINQWQLEIDGLPVAPPMEVSQLLTSIYLDWGDIPPEALVAGGSGEYSKDLKAQQDDPDKVWQGTYHEIGAELYDEWDYARRHYRKNWCVMREKDVPPVYDDFVEQTQQKYFGLSRHLHRTFEAMRDEDKLLKRQNQGDEIDIDALVEALADAQHGEEMSDNVYTKMHRHERHIAVVFMVDMSGSTQGWINTAEREALILLCEALETLGDRYAIYGFSGMTRQRCELYRIKEMDEPYNTEVKARISGIRAQDYTRMGFAIRHLSKLLSATEAKTRILITLSDGKPDDYSDYRGEYGIEDTRRALIEARQQQIHPYCITIDETARDYLPHLYGPAAFTVLDEVEQLPLKVADIYRRLTT